MDSSQISQIETPLEFGPQSKLDLDYEYDSILDVVKHFFLEPNEELKRELKPKLQKILGDLAFVLESRVAKLKHKEKALYLMNDY